MSKVLLRFFPRLLWSRLLWPGLLWPFFKISFTQAPLGGGSFSQALMTPSRFEDNFFPQKITKSKEKNRYFNNFYMFLVLWFPKLEFDRTLSFWGYFFCLATSPNRCDLPKQLTTVIRSTYLLKSCGIFFKILPCKLVAIHDKWPKNNKKIILYRPSAAVGAVRLKNTWPA